MISDPSRVAVRHAFTLIELLVVIAVIAVLISLVLPALAGARESGRAVICLSNLRQAGIACRGYADENRGLSPAIGQPYASLPNWALVVQQSSGLSGTSGGDLYAAGSVLVCPTSRARNGAGMQRTYAINATGHAGLGTDPDNYDLIAPQAHIRLDRVQFPSLLPLLLDSSPSPVGPDAPPPTRTASVLDFRQADHITIRLALIHAQGHGFQAVCIDGAAAARREVPAEWAQPLP